MFLNGFFSSNLSRLLPLHPLPPSRPLTPPTSGVLRWPGLAVGFYHEVTEAIVESRMIAGTLAASIAVILHSLLMRFKLDLNASDADWETAPPLNGGFSLGQVFTAAAANFRHYDEWAKAKELTKQQESNMTTLCGVLGLPLRNQHGYPTLRENVCGDVLMKITNGSIDDLHAMIFQYAKTLARF